MAEKGGFHGEGGRDGTGPPGGDAGYELGWRECASVRGIIEQTKQAQDTHRSLPIPTDMPVMSTLTGNTLCPPLHKQPVSPSPKKILCGCSRPPRGEQWRLSGESYIFQGLELGDRLVAQVQGRP